MLEWSSVAGGNGQIGAIVTVAQAPAAYANSAPLTANRQLQPLRSGVHGLA